MEKIEFLKCGKTFEARTEKKEKKIILKHIKNIILNVFFFLNKLNRNSEEIN